MNNPRWDLNKPVDVGSFNRYVLRCLEEWKGSGVDPCYLSEYRFHWVFIDQLYGGGLRSGPNEYLSDLLVHESQLERARKLFREVRGEVVERADV